MAVTELEEVFRRESGRVVATLIRFCGDFDLAQDAVQDTFLAAMRRWPAEGVPPNPGGWITTAAKRRAIDLIRREVRRADKEVLVANVEAMPDDLDAFEDDRLRLIFTCCHPSLATEAQVALTLRLLCGLSTGEVARAFLVTEPTMAARITRAKKKIASARIPYRMPSVADLPERTEAVLAVVHLLFTTGHTAPAGSDLIRRDLVERALDLARMLRTLLPDDADVAALLALILLTDARRETRVGPDGRLLLLADQDRTRWDAAQIAEGIDLVEEALRRRPRSRHTLQAAIAAVHAQAGSWPDTDWGRVVDLYDTLAEVWPSPVVALNRAAALGFARGPEAGLAALQPLAAEPQLAGYGYLPAARAAFLAELGRVAEARQAYEEAILLTENSVEREFLAGRLAELESPGR